MKGIKLLAALLIISVGVYAQNNNNKAQSLLDRTSAAIKAYKNMKVEFSYDMDNKEAKIHESKKGLLLVEGNKYRLNIAGQIIINDSKAVYTYIPDSKEVQINDPGEGDENLTPTSLLDSYQKKYRIKYIREEMQGSTNVMIIDLLPIEGKKFFKIRVEIDVKKNQLTSFALHDKNGNIYSYNIASFQTNIELKPNTFSFKTADYPGVEVVDMR
jgi:outer membrane lipoprotein-sorting protein